MFARFTENGVAWGDGQAEHVDTVIFATGYRPTLDFLTPLGVERAEGRVLQQYGISDCAQACTTTWASPTSALTPRRRCAGLGWMLQWRYDA
jgi:hypothetical protein